MKVVYLLGRAHCGSTVMTSLMDNFDRVFSAGELYIMGFPEEKSKRSPCSCGLPKKDCPFWEAVRKRFENGSTDMSWDHFREVVRLCDRASKAPLALLNLKKHKLIEKFIRGKKLLYECIAEESGCETIIETGRNPFIAHVLACNIDNFNILSMVRNGEDFLHSKLRRIQHGHGIWLHQLHFKPKKFFAPFMFLASLSWLYGNILSEIILLLHQNRTLRLRYEDLCADSEKTLKQVARFIDADAQNVSDSVNRGVELPIRHVYNGNMMSRAGKFVFSPTIGIGKSIPATYRWTFRAINWPLMLAYGYWQPLRIKPRS